MSMPIPSTTATSRSDELFGYGMVSRHEAASVLYTGLVEAVTKTGQVTPMSETS